VLARLPPSERFGWLVAPLSTIIQPCRGPQRADARPATKLDRLFASPIA